MALVAGEYMYQSDGVYSPTTDNTVWNTPYLSNLKVGSLSAISANTGSLTNTGTFTSGSSPALSGNSMVGTGGVIYANGNFAFGNDQTNIVFNGASAFINGFTAITATSFGASPVAYASTESWSSTLGTFAITKSSLAIISPVGGAFVALTGYSNVVAVLGVKPVVPALKLETPNDERFAHVGADAPLLCKICPAVPAAVNA